MNAYLSQIAWMLSHFDLSLFIAALVIFALHALIHRDVPAIDIFFRWVVIFCVGINGIYAFMMHAFFPDLAAAVIGWPPSPFQYEVAIANLAIGVLGVIAYNAPGNFRSAVVIAATIWYWGDAFGHIHNLILSGSFSFAIMPDWLWLDIIVPVLLILSVVKIKHAK